MSRKDLVLFDEPAPERRRFEPLLPTSYDRVVVQFSGGKDALAYVPHAWISTDTRDRTTEHETSDRGCGGNL